MPIKSEQQEQDPQLSPVKYVSSPEPSPTDGEGVIIECDDAPPGGEIYAGLALRLKANFSGGLKNADPAEYMFDWSTNWGSFVVDGAQLGQKAIDHSNVILLATNGVTANSIEVGAVVRKKGSDAKQIASDKKTFRVREPRLSDLKANFDQKADQVVSRLEKGVSVGLQRSAVAPTSDLALWVVIRESTRAIGFENYQRFMDLALCGVEDRTVDFGDGGALYDRLRQRRSLPFNDTDAYRLLKTATEAFLLVSGGVGGDALINFDFGAADLNALNARVDGVQFDQNRLDAWWRDYLVAVNGVNDTTIPYLLLVRNKLRDQPLKNQIFRFEDPLLDANVADFLDPRQCEGVLRSKLSRPFLLELIWSYWHEEGMLVQTMNALTRRFQNVRNPLGARDPLAGVEIDPLRPLNNILWGFIQDEQHRLSLVRRSYEYDHHYGISLEGKAVPQMRTADSRSRFLEAFHQLLNMCGAFFRQDDDTTVRADGFPLLNALREVHLILSQGAHNQFGDLPSTARQEMLLQQWLLARPEFREILPTRIMVAYPEPWMDRVDAMKSLQGWTDTSVQHFHNLGVFGEQLLLSIRYGAWNQPEAIPAQAANWARFWRAEIQGYVHAYRAATGVDLSAVAVAGQVDSIPPSVHLRKRLSRRIA